MLELGVLGVGVEGVDRVRMFDDLEKVSPDVLGVFIMGVDGDDCVRIFAEPGGSIFVEMEPMEIGRTSVGVENCL